ncbi:MAG TPA: type II secretion system F family protein [Acidimicrobiales bacterium]|nr:type II secretion system F family protein [Acidimicrobiales bacterium]
MTLVLLCAITATAGMALIAMSIVPRRRSLSAQLDELLATETGSLRPAGSFWDYLTRDLTNSVAIDRERFPKLAKDLLTTGETLEAFVRQILLFAALFGILTIALVATIAVEGLSVPRQLALGAVLLAAALGAVMPRLTLRSQAEDRRAEMREAVAVICDLAAVLVAAGEDVDGAVVAAAGAGAGWAFEEVRACLPLGGRQGTWVALERLGETLGVEEMVVLAQNMGLAEEKGAKVREALNGQARTLREQAASEVEAKAGSMTERMSFPMVMLLAGFLLVIGYPAVARL